MSEVADWDAVEALRDRKDSLITKHFVGTDIVGRRIKAIHQDPRSHSSLEKLLPGTLGEGRVVIEFEDGTWTLLRSPRSHGLAGDSIVAHSAPHEFVFDAEWLIEIGVVDREAVDEAQRDHDAAVAAWNLQEERERYERLKLKFGEAEAGEGNDL